MANRFFTKVFRPCTLATVLGTFSLTCIPCQIKAEEQQQQDTTALKQRVATVLSKAKEALSLEAVYKQKAQQIIQKYYEQQQGMQRTD